MLYKFTTIIYKEDDWYIAKCAENIIASQGKSLDEAVENLREAVELYYEDNEDEKPVQFNNIFISSMEVSI